MQLNPNNRLENDTSFKKMLEQIGKVKEISKNSVILREGQMCDFFFYVVSGVLRAYRFINDKELTIGFSFSGDVDTCPVSYIHNIESRDIIHSLTKSKVIMVNKWDHERYIEKNDGFEDKTNILLANYIETLIERHICHSLFTAEQNYLNLLKRNPIEVDNIPKSHIASYLGVSLERISRIRKKNILI